MTELRERLAEQAHDSWTSWMKYLFSKSTMNDDGSVTIPVALVGRWMRQMNTAYWNLSESEKESDRAEAVKILERIQPPDIDFHSINGLIDTTTNKPLVTMLEFLRQFDNNSTPDSNRR